MRRQPYTECKLYVDGIPQLKVGDYLCTPGGSAYCVTEIRQSKARPYRRNLRVLRWPTTEIPADATVHMLYWYPRRKKAARRLA
ncbi:hypothetical protein [Stenotrophomonas sp.]|uniref:hypothetical protein n=1 Tax=Stenotrophomonas sp. TaxID=69392 RepID=UPI0025DE96CF|nr:hypothetical protein [Stenotrophomonas sp.]